MYISNAIKSAVVVVLESAHAMENTKNPDTLFRKYDILLFVLNNVITPHLKNENYKVDKDRGFERYEVLYNTPISILQSLLITESTTVPISKILIVLALKLQEKLTEHKEETLERQKILDYISYQLAKRCPNLEQELIKMDDEFRESGKVEVFTFED